MEETQKAPNAAGRPAEVVDARQISKRYQRTWALRKVNLRVEAGTLVCLLGPNGSGKSTLLRIIAMTTRPTLGKLEVFGATPRERSVILSRLGVLSNRPYVYDELTARENLRFASSMYDAGLNDDALLAALASVGLERVADAAVRTFSSGMRKRLSLARATLHDPDLVLLDEPYGALDVEGIAWVDRFVHGLRAANKTAIIATHETGRARELCDFALGLRAGRVIYDGPASDYKLQVH